MLAPRRSCIERKCVQGLLCDRCVHDKRFLQSKQPLVSHDGLPVVTAADVFCGCGGMSLGLQEAARRAGFGFKTVLAIDSDPQVAEIYKRNIDDKIKVADVTTLFDGQLGSAPTFNEGQLAAQAGPVQILQGGPPCQGHSDLNNHTRRRDPKNSLYLSMVRAAEILRPDVVVIENVTAVQWDKSGVVDTATKVFEALGYSVEARVVDLGTAGVPQRRRRFLQLASKNSNVDPVSIFNSLAASWGDHPARTVRWAIEDLLNIHSASMFDTSSKKSEDNAARMAFLFESGRYNLPNDKRPRCHRDGGHSYKSVYGRLRWDRPAPTITTGFGSMGQGRYVHPQRRRTITPHEAARLQTFPDWFDFGKDTPRGILAKVIGNAVPPLLMMELGRHLVAALAKGTQAIIERNRA
jgi:DNA (cytosine-5)-methyltransferase 1